MKVIGKDRTSCDVCNPIDEILARLDALERRASAIVAKVQGIAPDGEGNVTLPTSSSDTDPLHGRVDAFAMSSEVKEASDDAHAYAASIADDVLVINSEIDALNQAVEALQPAEIEAIKAAVQTLQTAVATLESTVTTLNNSVAGKVSKSGDTMTGELIANGGLRTNFVRKLQSNGQNVGFVLFEETEASNIASLNAQKSTGTNSAVYPYLKLFANSDGTYYATLSSNHVGTNDNSDKIMTIKMANSLPSLVHTTGNETISGAKTFDSVPIIRKNGYTVAYTNPLATRGSAPSDTVWNRIQWTDKDGMEMGGIQFSLATDNSMIIEHYLNNGISSAWGLGIILSADGTIKATAPTTPSDATGTEIATANWVIAKINELASKTN